MVEFPFELLKSKGTETYESFEEFISKLQESARILVVKKESIGGWGVSPIFTAFDPATQIIFKYQANTFASSRVVLRLEQEGFVINEGNWETILS